MAVYSPSVDFTPWVDARSYGVDTTGLTSAAAQNTAMLQQAINDLALSSNTGRGGAIFLPPGKIAINGTLTLPPINNNLRGASLVGAGHNATQLFVMPNTNADAILVNGQFWTLRDFNIEGNYPSNTSAGNGITVNFTKTILQNLYVANARGDGIKLVQASQPAHAALLNNIYVVGCQGNGINASTGAYDLKASNIWIGQCGTGLLINSTEQHWTNLHSWGNTNEGVKVTAGDHLRFVNCYLETNGSHGLSINNAKDVMVSGSQFWANAGHGAYLFNAPGCVFAACVFTDNSNGVAGQSGIRGDGTSVDVSISACLFAIRNDGGVTSQQKYAIETISSCNRWTIVGNNMRAANHVTGSSSLVGANNINANNQV